MKERLRVRHRSTVDSPLDHFCGADSFLPAGTAAARDALVRSARSSTQALPAVAI